MVAAEDADPNNTRLQLTIAASYGGRQDIVQAVRSLAKEVAAGRLDPDAIDEALIAARSRWLICRRRICLSVPAATHRISNFLLWQLAYTELWFTERLWPDLDNATCARPGRLRQPGAPFRPHR